MAVLDSQRLQVAGVVTFYMSAALIMVFVGVSRTSPINFLALIIKIPTMDLAVAKKLVPVVSVNIIGLVFNTLCLRDVEASFFQIARGLVLPLTIAVSSAHTRSTPSQMVIMAAGIVTMGFMLGVAPSSSLPATAIPSTLSLFYGVFSSLFIAFHAVLIKSSLPYCNNSTIELAWWTNAGSAILILPFVIFNGEPSKLYELAQTETWNWTVFLWGTLVTGIFGFLLCVAGLLSIKVTSPITHMFSSAARSVLQTALGVWIFKDVLTTNRAASILVILGGTMLYTWIKSNDQPAAKPPPKRDIELGTTGARTDSTDREVLWQVDNVDETNSEKR
ncbi:hypothetical protein M413DRAFT_439311 [Hebeloma cylindrosporum]|uniref:Sugar phosphate transporter domain-containing protein n=1 Tax=Hebeloma cylindrosporum TaxID=76867 RepID=A0A0C3CUY1_HEBCY|nr:hypothetical protein M413DRAFT_439311 [Hebeloma cylindrosporum h7]